jgi:hypothetical protein
MPLLSDPEANVFVNELVLCLNLNHAEALLSKPPDDSKDRYTRLHDFKFFLYKVKRSVKELLRLRMSYRKGLRKP